MPPALKDQPVLTEEHRFYFDAFFFLSRFRGPGFSGPGPLNFSDVLRYAELVGYTDEAEQIFFSEVMAACDDAYRTHISNTTKKAESKPKSGRLPPKRGRR